jgi:CBS domain-containing protein
MASIKDLMTANPACCTAESSLQEAARLMLEHDCGEIPVIESQQDKKLIGVITDRDVTCRSVALGKNPLEMTVSQCMSSPAIYGTQEMSVEECIDLLSDHQIRRLPIVDESMCVCGIVSQADLALLTPEDEVGEFVKDISQPTVPIQAVH